MATETYTLDQAEEEVAALRSDAAAKEEQQEITTLIVDGQLTATGGTTAAPTLITTDTWQDSGALASGWSKSSGYFRWTLLSNGWVGVAINIAPDGTNSTDGTTILTAANGLGPAYRPATNKLVAGYVDVQRLVGSNSEAAGLSFHNDGSVACWGIAGGARSVILYGSFPIGF